MSILKIPRVKHRVFKKSALKSPHYIYNKRSNDYYEGEEFYNLSLQYNVIGGGENAVVVNVSPRKDEYLPNAVVTLTAVPAEGYVFTSWSNNVSNTETAETTITLNSDKTVTVTVTKLVELSVSAVGNGSVVADPEKAEYLFGEVVNLTAVAEPDNNFVNWTGDVESIEDVNAAETTITMDSDKTIAANFEIIVE